MDLEIKNLLYKSELENYFVSSKRGFKAAGTADDAQTRSPTQRFIDAHSISRIMGVLRKFRAREADLELFDKMIANESEGFLGYQAGSSTVAMLQDMIKIFVRDILNIEVPDDFVFLRIPGDEAFCYDSATDFLAEMGGNIPDLAWDTLPEVRQHLLSLNMNLYQSFDKEWDLTPRYYLENATWTRVNPWEIIKPLFAKVGVDGDTVEKLWTRALDLRSHERGYIIQFFDTSENFEFSRELSYVSRSGGKPIPSQANHDVLFDKDVSDFPQLRLVMGNESTLNPFSAIKMVRYDGMNNVERVRYESRLAALLGELDIDPTKAKAMRESLLELWGVKK
ncbi:MAG: hypothetical protein MRY21_00385 [Simkaniaceae bacterium]|nr:hypothetical protein [Simkaniaceae bacterium]